MFCPECGHNNPVQNRFCGMCGERLPGARERVAQANANLDDVAESQTGFPLTAIPDVRLAHDREIASDAALRDPAISVAPTSGRPVSPDNVAESTTETTLSGPSFLGLSGPSDSSDNFSYLFDEHEQRSHAGSWVFLALLVILGAAVYLNWNPIRTWVLNTALSHMKPPAPTQTTAASAETATGAPITTESSSPSQPAIEQQPPNQQASAIPQKDDAPSATSAEKQGATPKADRPGADAASDSQPATKSAKPATDDGDSSAGDTEDAKPAPQKSRARERQPEPPQGAELVNTGEKYLYGRGVRRSCDQAVTYFRAAAGKQNPRAFSHLGALYATGECVPMNRTLAYSWFRRAASADPNNPYLERNLNMLWRDMSAAERQKAGQERSF